MFVSRAGRISGSIVAVALMLGVGASVLVVGVAHASDLAPAAVPATAGVSIHYTIPLGKDPGGGAYDTRNQAVYVSNQKSDNVTVVSSSTHSHSSIPVGTSPYSILYDPNNGKLYVPNYNSSNVSIIYGATNKVIANPSLGNGARPTAVYLDPANGNVVVINESSYPHPDVAWIINGSTNTAKKVALGLGYLTLPVYSPSSKELYIQNQYSKTLSAILTSGTVRTIALTHEPDVLFYDPVSHLVLVTLVPSSFTAAGLYVAISSADKVVKTVKVHTSTVVGSLFASYDPYNHDVYLTGSNISTNRSYAVIVAPNATVVATPYLGNGILAVGCFYDPANGDVYYSGVAKNVVVLNQTSVVSNITTTQPILLFTYDPTLKDMIGAGDTNITTTSKLYIVTSTNTVSSITVGKEAIAFFYNPTDHYVWVANVGSDTIDLVG